jgi:hypothetical protein
MTNTKNITRTALLIALLVAAQYVTKAAGQIVTGSCVNLILATTALICGRGSGAVVALISPFCAFLLGIGTPIFALVPAIAAGNFVFVFLINLLYGKISGVVGNYAAVVLAAVGKFAALYLLIVRAILPTLGLPAKQVGVLSATFSYPQLVTALIGGVLAMTVVPMILRSLGEKK